MNTTLERVGHTDYKQLHLSHLYMNFPQGAGLLPKPLTWRGKMPREDLDSKNQAAYHHQPEGSERGTQSVSFFLASLPLPCCLHLHPHTHALQVCEPPVQQHRVQIKTPYRDFSPVETSHHGFVLAERVVYTDVLIFNEIVGHSLNS